MRIVRGLILTALAGIGLYLLAFARNAGPEDARGRVVVTYWEKWTGNEAEQMQEIVRDFNDTVGKDKGIYVRYLSMSNITQKTLVSTAAGVPPDVAGLWDAQVPQFAAIDAVEPLDELATEYGITPDLYKPVYWKGCTYEGKLYGLISTPAAAALHYNKSLFLERADRLRAAGLDPNRPPRTLDELDRYSEALDVTETDAVGKKRIRAAGHLPLEPGQWMPHMPYWFGGSVYDEKTGRLTLTRPEVVRTYDWVRSYSVRLGKDAMTDFTSGFGQFNSTQNAFLSGAVAMEQEGPWMANFIEDLKPSMNRRKFPKEQEKGMSPEERRENYEWGAAPFPSAVPGLDDVTFAAFDVLMIPKGAKHKKEAFEFIAYVNRQDVMEKLTSLHCKNSPLHRVSAGYLRNHPNPYIDVFERLAASPNAHGVPPVPIWPEVSDELTVTTQKIYLLQATPEDALADAQKRLQAKLDAFRARQRLRKGGAQ
ncbi:MAG: ABC transporter substrate-binding protein [Capsulimonadales bacterium]|nr:ABC transporter substrate-binding protein [Capsulimonadales bacterium]